MIHLNTAGAGLLEDSTREAMRLYEASEFENGSYETELEHRHVLTSRVYSNAARLLNVEESNIALFGSATNAWISAASGINLSSGDVVWVSPFEYAGNISWLLSSQGRNGFTIVTIPLSPSGDLDTEWMARNISNDVAAVCAPLIPSGYGNISDIGLLASVVHGYRALVIVDGCQAVGQINVDCAALGCDVFTAAGRKFLHGPRGTGFAYFSPRFLSSCSPAFTDVHRVVVESKPDRLELSYDEPCSAKDYEVAEMNPRSIIGLNEALQLTLARNIPEGLLASHFLRQALLDGFADRDLKLVSPGDSQGAIVSAVVSAPPELVVSRMREHGYNIWLMKGSDTPIYSRYAGVHRALRISPHFDVSEQDVLGFCARLRQFLR